MRARSTGPTTCGRWGPMGASNSRSACGIRRATPINPNDSHVFIVNGVPHSGGPCTIVETTNTGALVSTLTLPTVITDAEALAYDAREDVFYVSGGLSFK